jgi:hypothetical protein
LFIVPPHRIESYEYTLMGTIGYRELNLERSLDLTGITMLGKEDYWGDPLQED